MAKCAVVLVEKDTRPDPTIYLVPGHSFTKGSSVSNRSEAKYSNYIRSTAKYHAERDAAEECFS